MDGVEVAPEVAALVPCEDLRFLAEAAGTSYGCVVCGQAGRVPDQPAAVVVLRDGPLFSLAKLTHQACAGSAVFDVPGLQDRVTAESEASKSLVVAAWLPYPAGPVPGLLLETTVSVAVGDGDRVDGLASWLLGHGLHLIGAHAIEPPAAPGWLAELAPADGLRVLSPTTELVYDGHLIADEQWRAAVDHRRGCALLVGTGLNLRKAPRTLGEFDRRLATVAAAGRLVGGAITVKIVR